MRLVDEIEYRRIEATHSFVAGTCFGLFAAMAGLPFIFGGHWLLVLVGG